MTEQEIEQQAADLPTPGCIRCVNVRLVLRRSSLVHSYGEDGAAKVASWFIEHADMSEYDGCWETTQAWLKAFYEGEVREAVGNVTLPYLRSLLHLMEQEAAGELFYDERH